MKTLKFSGLLVLVLMSFSSCDKILDRLFSQGGREPDSIWYKLNFSFQDASGNDLVKGIELTEESSWPPDVPYKEATGGYVKNSSYRQEIIFSEPCHRPSSPRMDSYNKLAMTKFTDGYCYLTTHELFTHIKKDCPDEKMLTFKLKCPYVFGNEAVHELVTYWDIPKIRKWNTYATCNRIEFEGKVITPKIVESSQQKYVYMSYATIILESRETQ